MKDIIVVKRDGSYVTFDGKKISKAIKAAAGEIGNKIDHRKIDQIILNVKDFAADGGKNQVSIQEIQKFVEDGLMSSNEFDTARAYIVYRAEHDKARKSIDDLMGVYHDLTFTKSTDLDSKRDNANINSDSSMGLMLKYGSTASNYFADNYMLPKEFSRAHLNGDIHIHDKDFYYITSNCLPGDTEVIFKNGAEKVMYKNMNYFDPFFDKNNESIVDVSHCNFNILSKNSKFTKINKLMRRWHNDTLYKITTKSGFTISPTADHILEVKHKNGLTEDIPVKNIVIGDTLPITTYPEDLFLKINELNLIDEFGKHETDVVISNSDLLRKSIKPGMKTLFYAKLRKVKQCETDYALYIRNFTVKEYIAVRDLVDINEKDLMLSARGGRTSISAILPLNKQLAKMIGYILSEGFIDEKGSTIVFANKDRNLIDDFKENVLYNFPQVNITESNGKENNSTSDCDIVRLFGKIYIKLFKGIIAFKDHSNKIYMPNWFHKSNLDFLSGLFSAEIDGDGSVYKHYRFEITSGSLELLQQFQRVLLLNNIISNIIIGNKKGSIADFGNIESKRKNISYRLYVRGKETDVFSDVITDCFKINNIETVAQLRKNLNHGQIMSIEEIDFNDYVYDFETEDHFFDANGIISHNCSQIDLKRLFKGGFSTGHGHLREPQNIRSYASLACIAIQANQNDQFRPKCH